MAKQCPNCRKIAEDVLSAQCESCGFRYFVEDRRDTSFSSWCMRVGSMILMIAVLALLAERYI
jgi:hypothetical protein